MCDILVRGIVSDMCDISPFGVETKIDGAETSNDYSFCLIVLRMLARNTIRVPVKNILAVHLINLNMFYDTQCEGQF